MPTISVGETVNADDAMFKSNSDFFGWISFVFYPKQSVITKNFKFNWDLMFVHTNVFICFSELTCPIPYRSKHPLVEVANKFFGEHLFGFKFFAEDPLQSLLNIELFKLIQVTFGSDGFNAQTFLFFFINWGLPVNVIQI